MLLPTQNPTTLEPSPVPEPTPTTIAREPVSTSPGQSGTAPTETNDSMNTTSQSPTMSDSQIQVPISSATYYSFAYSSLLLIFWLSCFCGDDVMLVF